MSGRWKRWLVPSTTIANLRWWSNTLDLTCFDSTLVVALTAKEISCALVESRTSMGE